MAVTMIIRRIAPLSCAKIAGIVYAALGLVFGALVSIFSVLGSAFSAHQARPVPPVFGLLFGVGSIIILPIFYGVLGFVSAYAVAWLYNLLASRIGGIELDIS